MTDHLRTLNTISTFKAGQEWRGDLFGGRYAEQAA